MVQGGPLQSLDCYRNIQKTEFIMLNCICQLFAIYRFLGCYLPIQAGNPYKYQMLL